MRTFVAAVSLFAISLAANPAFSADKAKEDSRLMKSHEIFHEMMNAPDKGIPEDLLDKAHCIAIIPSVKKVAVLGIGGEHGEGIVTCRKNDGRGPWGPPSAYNMTGGSFGLQLGYSDTDFILLFMTKDGMEKLLQDKFSVGADMQGAAGPVGRTASAATDAQMHAEILTYSRSKGLFAGVSIKGAVLAPSHEANRALYGRDVTSKELLLEGNVKPPASAQELLQALNRYTPREDHH